MYVVADLHLHVFPPPLSSNSAVYLAVVVTDEAVDSLVARQPARSVVYGSGMKNYVAHLDLKGLHGSATDRFAQGSESAALV